MVESPPLVLVGTSLERVDLTEDLRWSHHIYSICSKTRRLLGLLYRSFYQQTDTQTLHQVCLSFVRPHLALFGILIYAKIYLNVLDVSNINNLITVVLRKQQQIKML